MLNMLKDKDSKTLTLQWIALIAIAARTVEGDYYGFYNRPPTLPP